ncbi:MAG: MerR family transcriptional regulator [Lachnospiraceae bacterium]|nr:MerR family transcriptional regulator [Lachnospiraceae bacterium]
MDRSKTLRELCDSLKVTRRVIQGYERAGLISATDKNKYGHLLYDEQSQEKIARIRLYQQLGFTIKDIQKLIDAPAMVVATTLEKRILQLKKEQENMNALIEKAHEIINDINSRRNMSH